MNSIPFLPLIGSSSDTMNIHSPTVEYEQEREREKEENLRKKDEKECMHPWMHNIHFLERERERERASEKERERERESTDGP